MELIGKLQGNQPRSGHWAMPGDLRACNDADQCAGAECMSFNGIKLLSITSYGKQHKPRSLDANAYHWAIGGIR